MTPSSLIAIDAKQVEHLGLASGFLSLVVGTVLRYYGERVCWNGYPADRPFFFAAYYLPSLTYSTSVLVDPEQLRGEWHDDAIEYGRDEPIALGRGCVISATVTNEFVTEPGYVGYRTTVVLDSHFEGAEALKEG